MQVNTNTIFSLVDGRCMLIRNVGPDGGTTQKTNIDNPIVVTNKYSLDSLYV